MLQVSLSQLDYSAIGFSKTMTEGFEDLKKAQGELTLRLDGIIAWYSVLMKQKEEAAAKAAAVAKVETTGEKTAEEGGEVAISQSVSNGQYCETRADLIEAIQVWMMEASRTIAMFPSKCSGDRKRRTIDFVNQTKVVLRRTKPIGEEETEDNAEWLEDYITELDDFKVVPAASALAIVGAEAHSAISGKKYSLPTSIRHSTPEANAKEKTEKMKKAEKVKPRKKKTKEVTRREEERGRGSHGALDSDRHDP